jgi:AAA domain, putative AbiEii toxin, Type IV TA system
MLLRVKNLGPVREAELDLGKPLIVLTGPNNSGKTYLAWAAYSLARLSAEKVEPPPALYVWADRLFEAAGQTIDPETLLGIEEDVLHAVSRAARETLPVDFAATAGRFDDTIIELISSADDWEKLLTRKSVYGRRHGDHFFMFQIGNGRLRVRVQDHGPGRDPDQDNEITIPSLREERGEAMKTGVAKLAVNLLMGFLLDQRYVALPVERLAINLFARELAAERSELVDELLIDAEDPLASNAMRDKLQRRAGRYPLAIRNAIDTAIRLSSKTKIGPLADLADELENSVLGGGVTLDANDEIRFVPHQDPKKTSLGLHESASVVKSLVSLVLYLRYDAQPGQRLVIDEPELNLHPDNQRRVTRILTKAVNRGLKIMMSTHSDYVIRELNNLIMLGQDSDEARALAQSLGYQPDQTLRPDQIGAYLVNDGMCTSLEVNEIGFETKTIEDEIHKLNHDAQTIYFRLFED